VSGEVKTSTCHDNFASTSPKAAADSETVVAFLILKAAHKIKEGFPVVTDNQTTAINSRCFKNAIPLIHSHLLTKHLHTARFCKITERILGFLPLTLACKYSTCIGCKMRKISNIGFSICRPDFTPDLVTTRPIWPFSVYATSKDDPLLISGTDMSPEEIRYQYYLEMATTKQCTNYVSIF
jgi:hypothetical protein